MGTKRGNRNDKTIEDWTLEELMHKDTPNRIPRKIIRIRDTSGKNEEYVEVKEDKRLVGSNSKHFEQSLTRLLGGVI